MLVFKLMYIPYKVFFLQKNNLNKQHTTALSKEAARMK